MKNDKNKQLWTSREVASYYAVSLSTISKWRKQEAIPFIALPGGDFRYDMEEVRRCLETLSEPRI